jgi:hypothetical protein
VSRAPSLLRGARGALLLVIFSATPPAAAANARSTNRRVDLVVARPPETAEMQQFEAALRGMLVAKGLGLASARKATITPEDVALATTASADEAASILARVFVDFAVPGHATLFLIDPRGGRIHVRRVTLDHGFDAVARASAVFVIEQSIDALLEGREIGVTREEYQRSVAAPAPAPAPAPATAAPGPPSVPVPPTESRARLRLAGGYEGVAMGSAAYQHAAKILVAARFARLQVAAAARVAAPISIAGAGAQAQLWTSGFSVSGAARFLSIGNLSVSAGLGGGLDLTRVEPAVSAPNVQAAAAFWAPGPSLQTFVEIEHLFGKISVAITLGVEAHLLAERYTVRIDSEARDVFVPRRVRPQAALLVGTVF